jgi:hypothetical protein
VVKKTLLRSTPRAAMRLVASSDSALVAMWDEEATESLLRSCPWVEDEVRGASDRLLATSGAGAGKLGTRLDSSLRGELLSRCTLRAYSAGETVAEKGRAVPGLVVVGLGCIEVKDGGRVERTIGLGEFLFPESVLGASPIPAAACAGPDGVLVFTAPRNVTQEMMVTCPPLLEILAGM